MSQSRETYLIGWGGFFIGKSSAVGRVHHQGSQANATVPKTGSRHYPATSPKYHVHSKPSLSIYLSIYVSAYVPDRFETHSPWFPFSNGRFGFDIFWHIRNRRVTARFKACIFYMYIIYKYIQIPRLYVCVYILTYKIIQTRVYIYIDR